MLTLTKKLEPVTPTSTVHEPDLQLILERTRTHDSLRPDLSRPAHAFTDEARGVSKKGYVKFISALRPVHEGLPNLVTDPEKAVSVKDLYLVTWLEGDPEDPRNWSGPWRWCTSVLCWDSMASACTDAVFTDITLVAALAVVSVAFSSAVITGDFSGIEHDLHVGEVVTALSVSLMVCGFG